MPAPEAEKEMLRKSKDEFSCVTKLSELVSLWGLCNMNYIYYFFLLPTAVAWSWSRALLPASTQILSNTCNITNTSKCKHLIQISSIHTPIHNHRHSLSLLTLYRKKYIESGPESKWPFLLLVRLDPRTTAELCSCYSNHDMLSQPFGCRHYFSSPLSLSLSFLTLVLLFLLSVLVVHAHSRAII